jgi:hypothetical protein
LPLLANTDPETHFDAKEMDKQREFRGHLFPTFYNAYYLDHRLENPVAHEHDENFTRQENILTCCEMAQVKAEVQISVLSVLKITRVEARSSLNEHISGGLVSYIQRVRSFQLYITRSS